MSERDGIRLAIECVNRHNHGFIKCHPMFIRGHNEAVKAITKELLSLIETAPIGGDYFEGFSEGVKVGQQEADSALREENARLREAVGLMTTMAPFMELDVNDPVGTAKTVWAEQEKLFQENARLRAALKPFVPKTQVIDAAIPDTRPIDVMVRAGELRAAAAAIREGATDE